MTAVADRTEFLGLSFDNLGIEDMLERLAQADGHAPFRYLVTPNVDHIVRLDAARRQGTSHDVERAYRGAAWCLCDSRILALLAKRKDVELAVTPGSDLTRHLLAEVVQPEDRLAIVGGDDETLGLLSLRYPRAQFVQHRPPMGLRSNSAALDEAATFVAREKARFIFLAVGSPQQELLAQRIQQRGDAVGIGLCVGASIDFITGQAKRAPGWMQRAHLEWAHRLLNNPRRLWRRYLIDGPRIFTLARKWRPASDRPLPPSSSA
jgi:exopolysaccharide biosynthesis WecB/TagA/CpsF family protein